MQKPSHQLGGNFSEKYNLYGRMVFKICMVYLGNKDDAEEAMQESFIKLLNKNPKFTDDEHEKAWLIRITTNVCKDILRSMWHKRVTKIEYIKDYFDETSDLYIMEEVLKLPTKYKDVIYLYYYEDYSIEKICKSLGIKESAVKMRLKRGRETLKLELGGKNYE